MTMAQPPLALVSDLAAWVGQDIPDSDPRAGAVLSAASALVRAYVGLTWADEDAPDAVAAVVVQVAARVWLNPANLESATIDDATRRWGSAGSLGMYLTESEKEILSGFVEGGPPDLGTLSFTRGEVDSRTVYVPTAPAPSGDPFPWYSSDEPGIQL